MKAIKAKILFWVNECFTDSKRSLYKDLWINVNLFSNKGHIIVDILCSTNTVLSEAKPSYVCILSNILKTFWHLPPDWSQAFVHEHVGIPAKRIFLVLYKDQFKWNFFQGALEVSNFVVISYTAAAAKKHPMDITRQYIQYWDICCYSVKSHNLNTFIYLKLKNF